jgi:penicillin-binding protein 1A
MRHPRVSRIFAVTFWFVASFGVGFVYASWAMVCRAGRCPSVDALQDYEPRQTSKLYSSDGRFIAELGLERRTLIPLSAIPPLVKNAFIVTEDKRFYQHSGIDWRRVPGAMLVDIRARNFNEGFSTITMQLARNIFPDRISRDKTLVRKLKEMKVARAIEAKYPKDKILELYLNQIYLGNGVYGVETAAQRYFGKSVKDLNVAEAATLAALPKGPERYNPVLFPDRTIQRRNTVIGLLQGANLITPTEASEARAYPLRLATRVQSGEVAPYFVEWIRQQLDDKFGRQLYEQGLTVFTTLDLDMQSAAERALERQIRAIEAGRYGKYPHPSYERYIARANGDDQNVSANSPYLQGAFIAMDPRTGAVRALVGGRDFDDNKFNRAVQALRQPGSTFKPIVYADAIQNGRPLSYVLNDSALTLQLAGSATWTPKNYEDNYAGKIPMRRALYQSRNLATIRLGLELGTQSVVDEARKFGLTTPIPGYPSIFIGAAEVYPIEIVAAYSAFATLGTRAAPLAIARVEDPKGRVLWSPQPVTTPVLSPEEAWLMVSAMKDVVQRGTAATTVGSVFHLPAGGKTGTTNDGTDVWFVGYTANLVAGVWMGFDKPQKIKEEAQGGLLAAPAWASFMNEVYQNKPAPPDWPMPAGLVTRTVDVSTNMLATPYCPKDVVANEFYISGTEPVVQCTVHTGSTLYPDTSLTAASPPPGSTYPVAPYSAGGPRRPGIDTTRRPGVGGSLPPGAAGVVPGGGMPIRPGRAPDTSRRFRDTSIFALPRRDTLLLKPRLDSSRIRDSLRGRPRRPPT